jgi:hypothetical protein
MSVKRFIKENFALAAGIGLPVILVALFFVASVLPKMLSTPPQYEVVFSVNYSNYSDGPQDHTIKFVVKNGRVMAEVTASKHPVYQREKLVAYDARADKLRPLDATFPKKPGLHAIPELKDMKLDTAFTAPDGYAYEDASYGGHGIASDIFTGGRYSRGPRLKKDSYGYKIDLRSNNVHYYNIQFIGWIVK